MEKIMSFEEFCNDLDGVPLTTCSIDDVLTPEKIKIAMDILEINNRQWMGQEYYTSSPDSGWYATFSEYNEMKGGENTMYLYRVCIVNTKMETFDIVNVIAKDGDTARIKGYNTLPMLEGSIDDIEINVQQLMSWDKE